MAVTMMANTYFMPGKVDMKVVNQQCNTAHITGQIFGAERINLTVKDVFTGNGLLKSPAINLEVGEFKFTGTINCSGTCKIVTQKPFDHAIFKQAGGGTFTILLQEKKPKKENDSKVEELALDDLTAEIAKVSVKEEAAKPKEPEKGTIKKEPSDFVDKNYMPRFNRGFFGPPKQ